MEAQVNEEMKENRALTSIYRLDCTGTIDTYKSLEKMGSKEWTRQPDRQIWFEANKLREKIGGTIYLEHNKSHVGSTDEEHVDREAKIAAKDSTRMRHAVTGPDLEWIFTQRNGGAFRGGPKAEI